MDNDVIVERVDLAGHGYDIVIGAGILAKAGTWLTPLARNGRMLVVTDSNVAAAVLPTLSAALAADNVALDVFTLPAGEGSKSWAHLQAITAWLLSHHVERADHIIALGGGVVGDITGFAASLVKRGCHFVQIPTSLLAQVDSSVGGKTAINTPEGKNLIGAFHQPSLVLIDPAVLDTLPMREQRAGWAEVLKYGLIDDAVFFDWCADNTAAFFAGDGQARVRAIQHSVAAKARIVAEDEKELTGRRALLNLGHTFGHALEAETGFGDKLLHGEGVAAGMALAARYSARRGEMSVAEADRVAVVLRGSGLPDGLAACGISGAGGTNGRILADHMLHDKKVSGGVLPFLLMRGIGATYLAKDVALDDVAAFLDEELGAGR
jgi:3-dehydroquinate synthase